MEVKEKFLKPVNISRISFAFSSSESWLWKKKKKWLYCQGQNLWPAAQMTEILSDFFVL